MAQQWNPLQDLVVLQDRMNRLFEDATQRRSQAEGSGDEFEHADWTPAADIYETESGFLLALDLPGIDREALEIDARTGGKFVTPFAMSGLASIATERGDFERAATLVGAAEAIMEAQQMAWPPDERPHYEQLLADLPEAMGTTRNI